MAYVKIIYQNSPSTATPINAENLNHMDDQIALNDQRLTEIETSYVKSFNGRTGNVVPEKGDYDINQIVASDGQDGYIPVWRNNGTEQEPDWGFAMEEQGGSGHEIQNQSGTLLPQEDILQFPDSHVTDDETNGRTIVENIKEHTTASDYENATEDGIHVTDDGNDALIGAVSDDYVEVTADGTKTYGALLSELYTLSDTTKITQYSILKIGTFVLYIDDIDVGAGAYRFERINSLTTSYMVIEQLGFKSSPYYRTATSTTSGNSFSDTLINGIPSSGTKITLYYGNRKAVVDLQTTANRCLMKNGESVESTIAGNELNCSVFFSTTAVANNYFAFLGYFSATPTLVSANVLGVGDAPISDFAIGGIDAHNFYVYTSNANYVGKAIYMKLRY